MFTLQNPMARFSLVTLIWLLFWFLSTLYQSLYGFDITASFWSAGVFTYPLVILAVFFFDRLIQRMHFFKQHPLALSFADSLIAIALYVPGLYVLLQIFSRWV